MEGYIYSIRGLSDEYDLPSRHYHIQGRDVTAEWQQYQLEELQGAYLILVLQHWTGNTIARARVRQNRFDKLAGVSFDCDPGDWDMY